MLHLFDAQPSWVLDIARQQNHHIRSNPRALTLVLCLRDFRKGSQQSWFVAVRVYFHLLAPLHDVEL